MSTTSFWQHILAYFEAGGQVLRSFFEPRTATDSVAFSIAFIALAAKIAKADGIVTRAEVTMFRHIFEIPVEEEANAARVYDLCRQETTGFETYARQLSRSLENSPTGDMLRENVLDGLFHIAMADGEYHENEEHFLRRAAEIFGLPEAVYMRLKARHVPEAHDPYRIVGVTHDASVEELRSVRRKFLYDNHPDRLIALGLPAEMIALGTTRVADFNNAFDEIMKISGNKGVPA